MTPSQAARAYLGIPFGHQGRNPAVAIDCIGLLVLAFRDAGIPLDDFDRVDYASDPHDGLLEEHLAAAFGQPVATGRGCAGALQPDDVVAMAFGRPIRHVGIIGSDGDRLKLIHTSHKSGKVSEHGIDAKIASLIKRVYRRAAA